LLKRSDFRRYVNYPIGTTAEQTLMVQASCCYQSVLVRITDVAGNVAEVQANNGGTGTPMSDGLFYGLIAGGVVLALIIIGVVAYFCRRKYSAVPTN
jgi:hypothetical protein